MRGEEAEKHTDLGDKESLRDRQRRKRQTDRCGETEVREEAGKSGRKRKRGRTARNRERERGRERQRQTETDRQTMKRVERNQREAKRRERERGRGREQRRTVRRRKVGGPGGVGSGR